MRQLNFFKASLMLLLASIVSGQIPELLWRSNVNCNGRSAVCVGPLSYQNCTAVSGVQIAQGEVFTCKMGYRCKNDGNDICVPFRFALGDVTTKGPNEFDSVIVGKIEDPSTAPSNASAAPAAEKTIVSENPKLPAVETSSLPSTVETTTLYTWTDEEITYESTTNNTPILESTLATSYPVNVEEAAATEQSISDLPVAEGPLKQLGEVASTIIKFIISPESSDPSANTTTQNSAVPQSPTANLDLTDSIPLNYLPVNTSHSGSTVNSANANGDKTILNKQQSAQPSGTLPVLSVNEVSKPVTGSSSSSSQPAEENSNVATGSVGPAFPVIANQSVVSAQQATPINNSSATWKQLSDSNATATGEPSLSAAVGASLIPISSQIPVNEVSSAQNGSPPIAIPSSQPAEENSNVATGSVVPALPAIANQLVVSAQKASPINNSSATWKQLSDSNATATGEPSLSAAVGASLIPISSQIPVNEVSSAQNGSPPIAIPSSQPAEENSNVATGSVVPALPAIANQSVVSAQKATPINNSSATWKQLSDSNATATGEPSLSAAVGASLIPISSQIPINEVASAQNGSSPIAIPYSQPTEENNNVGTGSVVPALPAIANQSVVAPINNSSASWNQLSDSTAISTGETSLSAAVEASLISISSQIPVNEASSAQNGSPTIAIASSQPTEENNNVGIGSVVPVLPSIANQSLVSAINNSSASWNQLSESAATAPGEPSLSAAVGVNQVLPEQSGAPQLMAASSQPTEETKNVLNNGSVVPAAPAIANQWIVSGQPATSINHSPASWKQTNDSKPNAAGEPSIAAAAGVSLIPISSQIPGSQVIPEQSSSHTLVAAPSQPSEENSSTGNGSIVPVLPAIANQSVVSAQPATPINNSSASWKQLSKSNPTASGEPSIAAAVGASLIPISSKIPVNQVILAQSGSPQWVAASSQPTENNDNAVNNGLAVPAPPSITNPSVVSGQPATSINNAPASWTQTDESNPTAYGEPSIAAFLGVSLIPISSKIPVNQVIPSQSGSPQWVAASLQPTEKNKNAVNNGLAVPALPSIANQWVVSGQPETSINNAPTSWTQTNERNPTAYGDPSIAASVGISLIPISSKIPVNQVIPAQSGAPQLTAASSQPKEKNNNAVNYGLAVPAAPSIANQWVVSSQPETPINIAPSSWKQTDERNPTAPGESSIRVPYDPISSKTLVNQVLPAQFGLPQFVPASSQTTEEINNVDNGSAVLTIAQKWVVSGQPATPIKNPPAYEGNPWLSGQQPIPAVSFPTISVAPIPVEQASDPLDSAVPEKPNPWLSWVPNWPWESNKENKPSNNNESSSSLALNDNTSEETQSNENKSSQSNESQSENDSSSNESFSKEVKRAVEDILKSLKNGKCASNVIYPNPNNCKKYYRCVQKSAKTKLEELHCDDNERFDAKNLICKKHAACITKEQFIQNYA